MNDKKLNYSSTPALFPANERLPAVDVMGQPTQEFEDSADIRDYIEVVLRRKWLVLSVLFAAFFTTLIVSYSMKPLYKASGRLELSPQAPRVTKFEDTLSSQLQSREFIQTQIKLLQSETLADRVINRLQMDSNPAFNPPAQAGGVAGSGTGLKSAISDAFKSITSPFRSKESESTTNERAEAQRKQGLQSKFLSSLEVQPERDTVLVSLGYSSPDPAVARDAINALIQEFIAWQVDKKLESSISAKKQLEKQIDLSRIQLEKAETSLNEFSRKAGIVSLGSNLNLVYSQLEEANKALINVQMERINKESLYNQSRQGSGSTPMIVESQMIQQLRGQLIALTAEYKDVSVTFHDDYPKLQNMKAKIQDLEKQVKTEENRVLESIKSDYFTVLKKEEVLKQDAEAKKALAIELNDRATQYKILEREVETSKLIHQSLFERSRELDARVGTELGNIQVVGYAPLPLFPYSPNIPRNLMISLLVGLIGGIGLAFLLEQLDNTIKKIDELSDRFQIPVLGVLPLVGEEESKDMGALVRVKPTAGFSESIRTAKVAIQLSSSLDQHPKMLLMTSTSAGEGKSTISANLAQTFAPEEKVLLIDADLRKPSLHRIFSSNGTKKKHKGLSNYLTGTSDLEGIVRETGVPNLHIINSGPIPPNPAELLASNRMRELLEEIDKIYDRIIIDGPPSTGFADAIILGHYADGVILVSTLGETHREALRIFRRNLANVGGRLIGSIVNRLNVSNRYGGYYYKYYRYYYRYYSYQPSYRQDEAPNLPSGGTLDGKNDTVGHA